MLSIGKDIEKLKVIYNDVRSDERADLLVDESNWSVANLIIMHED